MVRGNGDRGRLHVRRADGACVPLAGVSVGRALVRVRSCLGAPCGVAGAALVEASAQRRRMRRGV